MVSISRLAFVFLTIFQSQIVRIFAENQAADTLEKTAAFFENINNASMNGDRYDLEHIAELTANLSSLLDQFVHAYAKVSNAFGKGDPVDQKTADAFSKVTFELDAVKLVQNYSVESDISTLIDTTWRMGTWQIYKYERQMVNEMAELNRWYVRKPHDTETLRHLRETCEIPSEGFIFLHSVVDYIHDGCLRRNFLRLAYRNNQTDALNDQMFWFRAVTTEFMRAAFLEKVCEVVQEKRDEKESGDESKKVQAQWQDVVRKMKEQKQKMKERFQ